jgi:hypothetical protein
MLKLIAGLVCVLLVAVVVIGFIVRRIDDYQFRRWGLRRPLQVVCIQCQGRGWIQETVRSLDFDGTAFTGADTPATPCSACHGTGTVTR